MTVVTSGHNLDSLVEEVAADVTLSRIDEAVAALRYKPVCSTTLERIRITEKANHLVAGYPQPLKLGEGLYYLLDRIAVPVFPDDLIVGRIEEEVPDDAGEVFFWSTVARWNGKSIPAWPLLVVQYTIQR